MLIECFRDSIISGFDCYIDRVFAGAFGYPDDLVLLRPSVDILDTMITICEDFAKQYDVIYFYIALADLIIYVYIYIYILVKNSDFSILDRFHYMD